jgi:hypothetical protein
MRNYIYKYNLTHFTKIDHISYYLLGAVITDGCIRTSTGHGQVAVSSADKDWLEIMRDVSCPDKPIYYTEVDHCYTLVWSHPVIRQFFVDNKCTPRKSLTVEMPNVPDQYLPDFLRGCIDGDGCITIDNSIHCELSSGSQKFAQAIHDRLIDFNPKIYVDNGYYKVRFNGAYAYKFLRYVYYPKHKMSMSRKLKLFNQAISFYERYGFNTNLSANEIEHQVRVTTQSGSNNGAAKLDEDKVMLILELAKTKSTKELMKQFGVSKTTINRIKSGKRWKNITNQNQVANKLETEV